MPCAVTAAVLLLASVTAAEGEAVRPLQHCEIHVAPTGNDAHPGTCEQPLATPAAAQQMARRRLADRKADILQVTLHQGVYFLSEPLVFTPEDTQGAKEVTVAAAEGEQVVLSGGRRLTGWTRAQGEMWSVVLPGVQAGKWRFRNLWVNGRRAVRARTPNLDDNPSRVQLQGAHLAPDLKVFTYSLAPGVLRDWATPADVEVLMDGDWEVTRKRVQGVDAKAGTLLLAPPHRPMTPWNQPRAGRWGYLEGAREMLDRPGEWHLDRTTGVLSYWPLPGEDMAKAEAVAPLLPHLLRVIGTAERPVANLHFVGLAFEHTNWDIPEVGYYGVQACHFVEGQDPAGKWGRIPCAIRWDYAVRCSLRNGVVAHLGGGGIELVEGCRGDAIEGNEIADVGANGLMLGGPTDEARVPKDNRVANNLVQGCGVEHYGAVGIWVGFAQRTLLSHNEVRHLPYSGISLGWQWNPAPTPARENVVEFNHIHHVMRALGDGGGIYTLGFQPGTIIRGNHIHDVERSPHALGAPNNGMFIDEGSKGFHFERNVLYATAHQPVRFNQCAREWHTWKDNVEGGPKGAKDLAALRAALPSPALQQVLQDTPAQAGLEPAHRRRLLRD